MELMVMVPVSGPIALGAKMRFSAQEPPGARLIGEPVLGAPPATEPNPHQCTKLGGGPPVVSGKMLALLCVMLLSVSIAPPLLVIVMVCNALDDPRFVFGKVVTPEMVTTGIATPMPDNETDCE